MTDQVKQHILEAEKLASALGSAVGHTTVAHTAGLAAVQSNLTQCAVQTMLDLLKQKGVITEGEFDQALAVAYRTRRDQLRNRGLIVAAAPHVKPS